MFLAIIIVCIIALSYITSIRTDLSPIRIDNNENIIEEKLTIAANKTNQSGTEADNKQYKNLTEQEVIDSLNVVSPNDIFVPDGIDNITGWPINIVPNIVHYILFEKRTISYVHMLSVLSVLKAHKPDKIIIHCDCYQLDDDDTNWQRVLRVVNETNETTVLINTIVKPTKIYGKKIHHGNYHASDVTRYRIMNKYGGIYLDNDVFVCQSLDTFLKYEFTLNWDDGQFLASQILIGVPKSRFSRMVMETYKAYNQSLWYYNAAELPTRAILERYPYLVHRVKVKFGVDGPEACQYFYKEYHANWYSDYYTFHMLIHGDRITKRSRAWCLQDGEHFMWNARINDDFLKTLNTTFGEMGRYILFGKRKLEKLENNL